MKKVLLATVIALCFHLEVFAASPSSPSGYGGAPSSPADEEITSVESGGTNATALGPTLTNAGSVLSTTIPADRNVTGTTDTVLASDGGRIIVGQNASGIAVTLPSASAAGFTQGFGFIYENEGYGDLTITTASMFNNAFEPFLIKKGDGCEIRSVLSTSYKSSMSRCPAKAYNASFGTPIMTSSMDARLVYSNASANARYYYGATGLLTATTAATTPRMDYDPATLTAKGLLVETGATGLYDGNAPGLFNGAGTVVTAVSQTLPDGTTGNANLISEDTSAGRHYAAHQAFSVSSGTTYSCSVFLRPDTTTAAQMSLNAVDFGPGKYANVNLSTCEVAGHDASITARIEYLQGVAWCRIGVDGVTAIDTRTTSYACQIALINNDPNASKDPSYTGTGKRLYASRMNVTATRRYSSWISGTNSRLMDNVYVSADYLHLLNPKKGAVCVDFDVFENTSGGVIAGGYAVADALMRINSSGRLEAYDGTNTVDFGVALPTAGTRTRACVTYSGTSMNGAVNGTVGTAGTFDGSFDFANLRFFADNNGANGLSGHIHSIIVYPEGLSQVDLVRASTSL